jgi:hypothetical protein
LQEAGARRGKDRDRLVRQDRDRLVAELPASVLADLTGIGMSTADRWSQWAKRDWAAYAGQRVADDGEDVGSRKPAKETN